jgi:central kinetochore subunit Mis15/CHL4
LHTPAESIEELCTLYQTFKTEPGTKRDVIDRILDGDWRRGISLQQLAMIDFQHLQDHEASLRWTALKLVPLSPALGEDGTDPLKTQPTPPATESFPRVHPSAFIQALKHEISPLVKAHYYLHRLPAPHNLTILRLHIADTPYTNPVASTQAHFMDTARTLYIAFPDSCPYVYVALSGSGGGGGKKGVAMPKVDIAVLKRTVLEAVPKALSRPQQRYALEATALTAKSLATLCTLRGNGRSGACQGAYSIFADASAETGPLHVLKSSVQSKISAADEHDDDDDSSTPESGGALNRTRKRKALGERDSNMQPGTAKDGKEFKKRNVEVARRFGTTGLLDTKHRAPIDRLHVRLQADGPPPEDDAARTRHDGGTNAPAGQPAAHGTRKSKKASVLDIFDPQKNPSKSKTHIPPSSRAQCHSHAVPTISPLDAGVTLTFQGTDVFAGIRTLAQLGFVDLNKMPAWMTGEEGVSTATVRNGVVVDGRGGGA